MQYYFAPMEGVTNYTFRNEHARLFPGVDKYFSPFLAPDSSGNYKLSKMRDILPENNVGTPLVPQILCNSAYAFISVAKELAAMGYSEVNLNAGCPSGTVLSKHKGAGMLLDLKSLDEFLAEVFEKCDMKLSVKTRLGVKSTEEFPAILEIYNKYPIFELTIHARDRAGMYKSRPDTAAFVMACANTKHSLCYNGDIFSSGTFELIKAAVPTLDKIMLGRGAVANPALIRSISGGGPLESIELLEFHERLLAAVLELRIGDKYSLARMKELWFYMIRMFPDSPKGGKRIFKSQYISDYKSAVSELFAEGSFRADAEFSQ